MSGLYFLRFELREWFERGLFGWARAPSGEQNPQIAEVTHVIYEGLLKAVDHGVPRDVAAVLVDERLGHDILVDARARGLVTACSIDESGQKEFDTDDNFAAQLGAHDPTYWAVLLRYNPLGNTALNHSRADRLRRISESLHSTQRRLLLELRVPPEPPQLIEVAHDATAYERTLRPALIVDAIRELQDAGIEPDVWAVEGLDRREDCLAVVDMARRQRRDHVTCTVVPGQADDARLRQFLEVAATVPAFIGFAAGRTTYWNAIQELLANRRNTAETAAAIGRRYRDLIEIWEAARRARDIEVYADRDTLVRAEAERVVTLADAAIAARGRFSLALSGGSTPRPLYALLATPPFASRIDWARVHVFWVDERCVQPDHPESNYRMAHDALLEHVPIPAGNVHRIAGERVPYDAAAAYEQTLHRFFGVATGPPERSFDLVLLGMGEDGHTASLFPGTPPVAETKRWVVANHVASASHTPWRITLTPVVLNAATVVTFLVAGANKAQRLWDVLEGPTHSPPLPVELIHPTHGALRWMVDAAAARSLRKAP